MTNAVVAALAATEVFIGVLEHPQCQPEPTRAVRVLFAKGPARWKSLAGGSPQASFPTSWTVAFDGRSLGRVTTNDPGWQSAYQWTYPRDRLLSLVGEAPTMPNRKQLFGGWCEPPADRPLVVVSQANVADPAGWKRGDAPSDVRARVFPSFKAKAGRQLICPSDQPTTVDLDYAVKDLTLLVAYVDRQGRSLIAVSLDPRLNSCDGPTESAWSPNWFMIPANNGQPVFVGENLWLLDAGDYDRDGRSELLFWFSGYNRDGYVLFSDELANRVDYLWNYH